MDAKELVQKLSYEDITQILESLEADVVKETEEYIIFSSVCHGSDSHKLYLYKSSKTFFCYSNCGSMSLFDLIMKSKGISFKEAMNYIYDTINAKHRPRQLIKKFKATPLDDVVVEELPPVKKQFLYEVYSKDCIQEWIDEGISTNAHEVFKIRYDREKNRAIIPHFRSDGKVIGYRVRNLTPSDAERYGKYIPLFYGDECYNHPLGSNLYGINISKENIKKYKKCIIVEGEKSVLKYESFYPNKNLSVAICGSNFSNTQKKMLLDLGVEEIVIALDKQFQEDGDEESVEWKKKIKKMCENIKDRVRVTYIWDNGLLNYKDSPLDKDKKTFEKLIKSRVDINN